MKILHLIFRMRTGGTENMLIDIVNEQIAMGHDVTVGIINRGSNEDMIARFSEKAHILQFNREPGSTRIVPIIKLNAKVAALNPDVIHVHDQRAVNIIMLPWLRKRMVQTLHTTGIELTGCQLKVPCAAISQGVADEIKERQGVESTVVMNGILTAGINRRKPTDWLRHLVCVGRMSIDIKGQDLLIKALTEVKDVDVTFIGDGPDLKAMKALAEQLYVADRITFKGAMTRDDIYASLCNYDAFILPSRQEGFGLVLAEAMAAALPVITCDLPGPMEVINGGMYGESFKTGDYKSLAAAIKRLQGVWPEAQSVASSEAYAFVKQRFGVRTTIKNYLELYSRIGS